jgi:hypothetical protein
LGLQGQLEFQAFQEIQERQGFKVILGLQELARLAQLEILVQQEPLGFQD